MDPLYLYGVLMLILLFVNVTVAYLLSRGVIDSKRSVPALNERAFTAVTKSISVAILNILVANRAFDWHWPPEAAVGLLVIATLITSASPIGWLWLYFTNKFGNGNDNTSDPNEVIMFGSNRRDNK